MARRRVNLSLNPDEFSRLQAIGKSYGLASVCELVTALIHIFLDRMSHTDKRKIDLPEDDAEYIDSMFEGLSYHEKQPDSSEVPKRRKQGNMYGGNDNGKRR